MAIAVVAHTGAPSLNNNSITTSGITTTGATLLIMAVGHYGGANPTEAALLAAVSDSNSNTWLKLSPGVYESGQASLDLFFVTNPTVGAAHTFTFNLASTYPSVCVLALSGTATTAQWGCALTSNAAGSVTSVTPGSITPAVANAIMINAIAQEIQRTLSISVGTITDTPFNSGTSTPMALAYTIQTTATASNPNWTWTGSGATQTAAMQTTFFPPTASAAVTTGYGFAG
jgi:hypothetical protein